MPQIRFESDGVSFPSLNLRRDPATRVLVFDVAPLRDLIVRNGMAMESIYKMSQDGLRELVLAWYIECKSRGGHCSAEIDLAVRELLSPNPTYKIILRPACLSPDPQEALSAAKSANWPLLEAHKEPSTGIFASLRARLRSAFGVESQDLPVGHFEYADYHVPSGPGLHLRPRHLRPPFQG